MDKTAEAEDKKEASAQEVTKKTTKAKEKKDQYHFFLPYGLIMFGSL